MRTVGTFTVLSVAMATMAVLHDGTETADLHLNDGGVWVTNLSLPGGRAVAAHLNYPSRTLDSYTEPAMNGFDVSQEANAVVLHDGQSPRLASVNTATWQSGAVGQLPPGAVAVQGTDVVAIADANQGKVWVLPADAVDTYSAELTPVLDGAVGVQVSVGKDDVVHTVTPDGTLRDLRPTDGSYASREVGSVPQFVPNEDAVSVTAVGSTPVVMSIAVDGSQGWVAWPDHRVELSEPAGAVLQQPSTRTAAVAVATPGALDLIDLDEAEVARRDVTPAQAAIAPVSVAGCTYAAWLSTGHFVRDCVGEDDDVEEDYAQLVERAQDGTVFRTNRDVVVLNDQKDGDVFLVDEEMSIVDDWSTIAAQLETDDKKNNDDEVSVQLPDRPKENRPPKAEPDRYGVRAGQSITLPVLANDTDPDGDILLAAPGTDTTPLGDLAPVRDGRALRLSVPADASGAADFTYTADDGRDNGTSEAPVQVEVHPQDVNAGPVQIPGRTSAVQMVERGSAEHRILQEWMDPDGDAFWIDDVRFPAGMDGVFRPDGLIKVNDDGTEPPGLREVEVVLTDGRDQSTAILSVDVRPRGALLAPTANADFVTAEVGQSVVVSPLTNDTDPEGAPLILTQVDPDAGTRTVGDLTDGTVTLSSDQAGVHYLDYAISDGPGSATGVIRFDVEDPSTSDALPIPDNDLAVLPASGEALVDVLTNDTDPLGGVLVLQSVSQKAGSGITAEVVDHEVLRVHNNGMSGPVTLSYQVGNANGSAQGSVTVVQAKGDGEQTPIAYDDRAVVRSGDVVSVDVLDNDVSPGDRPLHVQPDLDVVDGDDLGTAFVSEDQVRFKADADTGTARIKYTVVDPDQNASTATLEVTIRPLSGSNAAPSPKVLTSRLVEGGTTEIAVPLDDIDPDGDSVTLLGLQDAPTKGVATIRGGLITYTSSGGVVGSGTDTFSYVVEDRFGEQGVGTVRVGIAPPAATNEPPIATRDDVLVRPGRDLSIPVTANDIDPEGEPLTLVGEPKPVDDATGSAAEPQIEEGRVFLTTPAEPGTLRYTYDVADEVESTTTGSLVVSVDPQAPLQPPVARDDVVPLADVIGQTQVVVEVLDNDEDPDGAASRLSPTSDAAGVTPTSDGRLTIPLTAQRQVIVYSLTDVDGQVGQAVIVVPGTESLAARRPVVRNDAALPLQVKAGEQLEIPVGDYVAVRPGRSPQVPLTEEVEPGPGWDGSAPLRDPETLVFRATEDFYGLSSVTFLVSDGPQDDPEALSSVLTLPIEVESAGRTRPEFTAPLIEVTPGEGAWVRDLRAFATDPDPGDLEKLEFAIGGDVPPGLSAEIGSDGATLTVGADASVEPGLSRQLDLTVTDQTTEPLTTQLSVRTVATTRPLMTVRPASFTDADAGEPLQVDLTEFVTNPYADTGEPINLVSARVTASRGQADGSGQQLIVTPAEDFHGTMTVTYVVADASGEVSRQVQGQVRVSVRARPETPSRPTAVATKSHTVEVSWRAPANNGAPITGYTVSWTGGESGSQEVGNRTSLRVGDLTNDRDYTFTIVATNEVGDSEASPASRQARPDEVPAAPSNVRLSFGDTSLDVTWDQPKFEGSAVKKYQVSYNGAIATTDGPQRRITLDGLTNGTSYNVMVRGINDAEAEVDGVPGAGPWSPVANEHPNGEPSAPTGLSIDADGPDPDPSAVVSWNAPADNGEPIAKYEVRKGGGNPVPCASVTATSCRVSLTAGEDATFSVRAFNRTHPAKSAIDGWGEWSSATEAVRGAKPPGPVTNLRVAPTGESGRAEVTFGDADLNGAESIEYHYSTAGGGSGSIPKGGGIIGGLPDGADRAVEVWAVSTANGKESDPGEHRSDDVNTFAPCGLSLGAATASSWQVSFTWTTSSHGRDCTISGEGQGWTGRDRTASFLKEGGYDSVVGATVSVRTERQAEDPGGGYPTDRGASARTGKPSIDWGAGDSGCTTFTPCRFASLTLTGWRPGDTADCTMGGAGAGNWRGSFAVPNGSAYSSKTWQYQEGSRYDQARFPTMYDGWDIGTCR